MKLSYALSIASTLSCLALVPPIANAGKLTQSTGCTVLGRVLRSHDSGITPSSPLCQGEYITVGHKLKVYVSCHDRRKNRWLQSGRYSIDQLCAQAAVRPCWIIPCKTRSVSRLALITPRASVIKTTPDLEWSSIENTEYYEIQISTWGEDSFKTKVKENRLDLLQRYPLSSGKVYKIKVSAIGQDSVLESANFSLSVPSAEVLDELSDILLAIERGPYSREEKIKLTDSAYMSAGLIETAIEYLESEFKLSRTVMLARLLGDRYAEVGDSVKAEENYKFVKQNGSKGSYDYVLADEMLDRIASLDTTANSP